MPETDTSPENTQLGFLKMDSRSAAARILATVLQDKQPLDRNMPKIMEQLQDPKDRAFTQEL